MYYIGYCRVSSVDNRQNIGLEVQKTALAFCDEIITEKASGYNDNRSGLKRALRLAKKRRKDGEVTLCIYRLDRLTRRMLGLFDIINTLNSSDIYLMSHCEQIETNTLTGRLLMMVLGYVAEMELHNIRTRTKDGLRKAREMGVVLGRPPYHEEVQQSVCQAYLDSELPVDQIAANHGVSRATLYRMLQRNGIKCTRDKRA